MIAIFKRELKAYFNSMIGFLFVAFLLAFTGVFVTSYNLLGGYTAFEYALESTAIVFLLAVPILTMRSIADDKRLKTDKLLYSLPVKLSQVIVGKYLAMLAVLLIPTVILALYPLILSAFGTVNYAVSYACLFGFFLLGAALIAICMFLSSLAESQIVAAILGFAAVLLVYMAESISSMIPETAVVSLLCLIAVAALVGLVGYFLTKHVPLSFIIGGTLAAILLIVFLIDSSLFAGLFPALLSKLALFDHFGIFSYGLLDIPALILYLSVSVFFVTLTILGAEKKRWA
jgi:ABC-2 type transport system permease protein